MKKKLCGVLLIALLVTGVAACGAEKQGTKAKENKTGTYTEQEQKLAEELLNRSVTPEDEITDGVVEAEIELLKKKYPFEKDVKEIKYGSQFQDYLAESKGWYKKLFDDQGIKTTRVDDAEDNEEILLAKGDLTFANRMLYPFLVYANRGSDVTAIWATGNPDPQIMNVLVPADSDYKTFSDLKGKKIATNSTGCAYAALFELADHEGWKEGKDWTYVDTKELKDALLAGEVDAVVSHPSTKINSLILSGQVKVLSNALENGVYVNGGGSRVLFTTKEFAKNDPNVARAYIKIFELSGAYAIKNEKSAAAAIEKITRIAAENNIYWWEASKGTLYGSQKTLEELKKSYQKYDQYLVEHDTNFTQELDFDNGVFAENYFVK